MRGGARLGCVVNGQAGRETLFADAKPPRGERIAVIGAGPAGLTYASLVADGEYGHRLRAGAAQPGSASLCRQSAALSRASSRAEQSFARYIDQLYRACLVKKGVMLALIDRRRRAAPGCLAPFDRIVVATGAEYRFGLGPLAELDARPWRRARAGSGALVRAWPAFRDWFYYRGAASHRRPFPKLWRGPGKAVIVIGDAARAGKSKQAIASAFEAALLRQGRSNRNYAISRLGALK